MGRGGWRFGIAVVNISGPASGDRAVSREDRKGCEGENSAARIPIYRDALPLAFWDVRCLLRFSDVYVVRGTIALTLTQWLPKPATSQFPEKERSLREMWSPGERGQLRQRQVFWSNLDRESALGIRESHHFLRPNDLPSQPWVAFRRGGARKWLRACWFVLWGLEMDPTSDRSAARTE